jgi:hypothetical protein
MGRTMPFVRNDSLNGDSSGWRVEDMSSSRRLYESVLVAGHGNTRIAWKSINIYRRSRYLSVQHGVILSILQ